MTLRTYWIMGAMAFVAWALTVALAVAVAWALATAVTWGLAQAGITAWPLVHPVVWGAGVLLFAPIFMGQAMPPLVEAFQRLRSSAPRRRR